MLRDNIAKLGDPLVLAKAKKYLVAVGVGLDNSEAAVRKLEELMLEPQLAREPLATEVVFMGLPRSSQGVVEVGRQRARDARQLFSECDLRRICGGTS